MNAADLGIDMAPRNKVLSVEDPPARKGGVVVESVDDLIKKLKTEAAVI